MRHANGALVEVELLRPGRWVIDKNLHPGGGIDLWLTEIDVRGSGKVLSIEPFGELEQSSGRVVTGRFKTVRPSELVEVRFADGSKLAGTPNHPVWSLSANDWTGLGELSEGEQVQSAGGPLAVVSVEPLASFESVYNIEVDGEHVYQAGDAGILVHNNAAGIDCGRLIKLRNQKAQGSLSPEELDELGRLESAVKSAGLVSLKPGEVAVGFVDRHGNVIGEWSKDLKGGHDAASFNVPGLRSRLESGNAFAVTVGRNADGTIVVYGSGTFQVPGGLPKNLIDSVKDKVY